MGWWRTIDFILVLAVAACSITTFSVDWDYRVVHALQVRNPVGALVC